MFRADNKRKKERERGGKGEAEREAGRERGSKHTDKKCREGGKAREEEEEREW